MATSKDFKDYISDCLLWINWIRFKYMFWEYALYKNNIVIWFLCDNTFFIKITLWNLDFLWENHEVWQPYQKAKPHFVIWEEIMLDTEKLRNLIDISYNDLK